MGKASDKGLERLIRETKKAQKTIYGTSLEQKYGQKSFHIAGKTRHEKKTKQVKSSDNSSIKNTGLAGKQKKGKLKSAFRGMLSFAAYSSLALVIGVGSYVSIQAYRHKDRSSFYAELKKEAAITAAFYDQGAVIRAATGEIKKYAISKNGSSLEHDRLPYKSINEIVQYSIPLLIKNRKAELLTRKEIFFAARSMLEARPELLTALGPKSKSYMERLVLDSYKNSAKQKVTNLFEAIKEKARQGYIYTKEKLNELIE